MKGELMKKLVDLMCHNKEKNAIFFIQKKIQ